MSGRQTRVVAEVRRLDMRSLRRFESQVWRLRSKISGKRTNRSQPHQAKTPKAFMCSLARLRDSRNRAGVFFYAQKLKAEKNELRKWNYGLLMTRPSLTRRAGKEGRAALEVEHAIERSLRCDWVRIARRAHVFPSPTRP